MTIQREQLIWELRTIRENQYRVSGDKNLWELVLVMLNYIGDTDYELRDDLILSTLFVWIDAKGLFSEEQVRYILSAVMDEGHLFYQIGSDGDDSIFTRSFSLLIVVRIFNRHRKEAFLSAGEFTDIKNRLIEYCASEVDLRGYIQKSGWAHAAAHSADVWNELVQCRECSVEIIEEILKAFQKILYNGKYIFHNEEDERISRVVFRIIKENRFPKQSVALWLEQLCECVGWPGSRMQYVARVNSKNFIRCLYFKMMHYDQAMGRTIFKVEETLNRFLTVDRELMTTDKEYLR